MGKPSPIDVATSMGMNELHVTLGDRSYSFGADETVRIGRSPDNDIVVSDPTVSRQHAQLSLGPSGWEFENVGRALSFLDGEPVTQAVLTGPAQVQLSSVRGPVLSITLGDTVTPRLGTPGDVGESATAGYSGPSAWHDYPSPAASPQYEQPQYEQQAFPQYELPLPGVPLADVPQSGFPEPGLPPAGETLAEFRSPVLPSLPEDSSGSEGPGPSDYASQRDYTAQPDYPDYTAQPDYPDYTVQPDYPDYAAQPDHSSQPGYPGQAMEPGQLDGVEPQPDHTSVLESPISPGNSGSPDSAGYPDGPAYPGGPAYLAGSVFPAGGGYSGAAGYPGDRSSAEGAGYPDGAGHTQVSGGADGTAGSGADGTAGSAAGTAGSAAGTAGYPDGAGYPGREVPRIRPVQSPQPVDEIATALHILVPIRSWLHDPGWRQFLRLLVIPYGLLPLIFIALFASSSDLSTPGWAYSLYIAPLWAIVFWLLIRPGQVERREVLIGIAAIVFALIWIRVITVHVNGLMGHPGKPLSFFGAIGVGINEEITKALPILLAALLLLKYRSIKLDVRMWMFLGTIVGLAFGVTEQAGYTLQDIQGITSARANSQAIVEVLAFAERVFVDGFQHAMWAGVSAFFIGIAVNYPRRRMQLIAFGIAVPAVLHGLYDWSAGAFASLWVPIIIQALSLFLFLGYTMSAAAIERQVRRTPMFRGESMLMERITDGQPPPQADPRPTRGGAQPPEDWARPPGGAQPPEDWARSPGGAQPPEDWARPQQDWQLPPSAS